MSNNNASNKTRISNRRWDLLCKKHIGETLSERTMSVEMDNRMMKECHVRTKPRLLDVVATGGFGVTRKNKKGGNNA